MIAARRTRRPKYGNTRVRVEGEMRAFDSKREAEVWKKLKLLESRGIVRGLTRQAKFPLSVNGQPIGNYVADFTWVEDGAFIVADAKGYRTREYLMKRKLVKAIYGYEIREL